MKPLSTLDRLWTSAMYFIIVHVIKIGKTK